MAAQNLTLKIVAEKDVSTTLIDSLDVLLNFENYRLLKAEADSLPLKLQNLGFIDAILKKLEKENDSSYQATYYLGNRWKNVELYFSKNDFSISEVKEISSNVTDSIVTLPIENVPFALKKLSQLKAEKGDPFSKIKVTHIEKINNETIKARLNVTTTKPRTIDGIVVKGYEKFPRSFLKYFAGIKKGNVFNQKEVVEQNTTVATLGFVNTIKPPEALFKKDTTIIYLYYEKANNNLFDGILGFATNETSQKIVFNGYLNLELNNNLNFGEQLSINYKADGREQQNLRVFTKLPYVFKTPFGLSAALEIFKRDTTFSTTHQEARLYYQATPTIDFYIGYKSYESSNLLEESNAASFVEDFRSNYFLSGVHYSKMQNERLTPIKTYLGLESEIGNRTTATEKINQVRLSGIFSHIFMLNERNSVFIKNQTSFLSSPNYVTNELFRFGGINTIRGFSENSIDASMFSVMNTEYRFQMDQNAYIHSIIDVGYFENTLLQIKEELYGLGLGLALKTKAGLFKFNIANGISKNQNVGLENTKIHLLFLTKF